MTVPPHYMCPYQVTSWIEAEAHQPEEEENPVVDAEPELFGAMIGLPWASHESASKRHISAKGMELLDQAKRDGSNVFTVSVDEGGYHTQTEMTLLDCYHLELVRCAQ